MEVDAVEEINNQDDHPGPLQQHVGVEEPMMPRRSRRSDDEISNPYPMPRFVRWRVVEVGPPSSNRDVASHYSDEFNLVLDPINIEFKFRLVFKIRQDHYEIYMESLMDRDLELKLGM